MRRDCGEDCPFCYANRRGRQNYKGHWGYRKKAPGRGSEMAKFKDLPPASIEVPDVALYPTDAIVEEWFPALFEYISEQITSPQGYNLTPTVMLTKERGAFKTCLNDRPKDRSLWREGSSIFGALAALERDLQTGGTGWRYFKPQGVPKKPRG